MSILATTFRLLFPFSAALLAAGCNCISVPNSDASRPLAALRLSYNNASGAAVATYVDSGANNAPLTVTVPAGHSFVLTRTGNDDGGVKSLTVWFERVDPPLPTDSQSEVNQIQDVGERPYSGCPKKYRLESQTYRWEGHPITWTFHLEAKDYNNNTARTPALTVRQGL